MKTLVEALRSEEFAFTAELSLNPQQSARDVIDQARTIARMADAVQIPDHRDARPHISNIVVAAHLMRHNIDPVIHINCRDRNRIAIQSDLLAAQSLGVSNLLLQRGAKLPDDHSPPATGVYDVSAIDLVRAAAAIRDGESLSGGKLEDAPEFYIGTVATAFSPTSIWEPEKLLAKAEAGAQFVQLQLCMNPDVVRKYMARLVQSKLTWRFQVLVNVAVLPSAEAARELRQAQPDAVIPSALVDRLEQSADPEAEGVIIAAEILQSLLEVPGIAGANLVTPGDPESITATISASKILFDRNERAQ